MVIRDRRGRVLCSLGCHELRGALLCQKLLDHADLRGLDLSQAYLSGGRLRGADLRDADLRQAHLDGAQLAGADLRAADLRAASCHRTNFEGADLRGADLRDANLDGADCSAADLRGADLRGARLRFGGPTDLEWAHVDAFNLHHVDQLPEDFPETVLDRARLGQALLGDPATGWSARWLLVWELQSVGGAQRELVGVDLSDVDLQGVDLHAAVLRHACLRGACLSAADLHAADLQDADLQGADLRQADLREADLRETQLHGVQWRGALYNGGTRWPGRRPRGLIQCAEPPVVRGLTRALPSEAGDRSLSGERPSLAAARPAPGDQDG